MKYILLLILTLVVGCDQKNTKVIIQDIVNESIGDDCNLWIEKGITDNSFIRIGYSGSCKNLSLIKYSRVIKVAFEKYNINKKNHPKVHLFYVNSYVTYGEMNKELNDKFLQSELPLSKKSDCTSHELSITFKIFNEKNKYLLPIENILSKEFDSVKNVSFEGVLPYNFNEGSNKSKCVPDSFGVATFKTK